MEDGLKQRIYENILKFMENYRYIKSTAEATMPNFIFQNSPLLSLNFYLSQWRLHQFYTNLRCTTPYAQNRDSETEGWLLTKTRL